MFEIALGIAIFCILISVITSYLLKFELKRSGVSDSAIQSTRFIALGMPSINSVKAEVLIPGNKELNPCELSFLSKVYLYVIRATMFLAIISIITGAVIELWFSA